MREPARDLQREWTEAVRNGEHEAAWAVNDAALAARDPATRDDPNLPYHRRWVWDGRAFDGLHVLVKCYHGLGDTLQFMRFLPALRARAASVTVEVQPGLLTLLAGAGLGVALVPFDPARPLPPSACDFEIMELSHALRTAPETAPPPYVFPTPARLPPDAVGLCWRAGDWDRDRSIDPAWLDGITRRPCVALQPDAGGVRVLNPGGCPSDIEATAALIAGTSVVVTVDTMVAHLAGATNHPVCLLLKHDADWRWTATADGTSAWYPATRLYRQTSPGDWREAVGRLKADLIRAGD